jgi:uncharacterized protein YbjT (DUF2867 family)
MIARQPDGDGPDTERIVTVFGGTGFLGRRIVKRLLSEGFIVRAVSRHPKRASEDYTPDLRGAVPVKGDILDPLSVAAALDGANAAVNAVSLYIERGEQTFERVHVTAAADLARAARDKGSRQLIQISGIGSDPRSDAKYIRERGRGEDAVKTAFPGACIVRPAVMTGPDDAFLTTIVRLIRRLPVYPLFGNGKTQLQPAYVEDVAEAVSRIIAGQGPDGASTFEFGGPRIYTYEELVREIGRQLKVRVRLVPMPFAAWSALAGIAAVLPSPPITSNQVDLMRHDNIATRGRPGLQELGIEPRGVDNVIQLIEQRSDANAAHHS